VAVVGAISTVAVAWLNKSQLPVTSTPSQLLNYAHSPGQNPKPVFLVIMSTQSLAEAKATADELKAKGYEATVYKSINGSLAVTIKSLSKSDAEAMLERLKQVALVREDSYLSNGERWTEKIYP
jgi:SPOR domain